MPPRNARGRAKSLTGARGACGPRGARRNLDEGDDHQESMMEGRASAPVENIGNVGGAPPTILGGAEFMQGMFTAIEQVVRNTVQTMQVPVRTAESRATTSMKGFLQLRPPTFKGEPDPLVTKDWLEQVTRALDTILVTEEDLRVLFASYQLQRDALQWWKTMEEVAQGQSLVMGPPTCYRCGQVGHISRQCMQRENSQGATGSQQPIRSVQASRATLAFTSAQTSYQSRPQAVAQQGQRTQGRVYAITSAAGPSGIARQQEQQLDTSVVRGTLLMFNTRARVLIDTGASHSFIASSFALALGLKVEILDSVFMLDTPMGGP
ncbi:hypothetical protein Acr_00g0034090 [Actinidia rufa]|uniref:CCHC-type domain-containing protein n=1 Tax=Actinidia rufa TaxID=165716 RepID=A0A7J0DFV2_9ERIC|nr:hypothetical protein Acr_00g0034090 [Actinidia rufa]